MKDINSHTHKKMQLRLKSLSLTSKGKQRHMNELLKNSNNQKHSASLMKHYYEQMNMSMRENNNEGQFSRLLLF